MADSYSPDSTGISEPNMAPGSSRFVPRRSSYASVVTGNSWAASHGNTVASGLFSRPHDQNTDINHDLHQSLSQSRYGYQPSELSSSTGGMVHRRTGSITHGARLPRSSCAFNSLLNEFESSTVEQTDKFFIPSYLKGSMYIKKLEEVNKTRNTVQKEEAPVPPSRLGPLSTIASNANFHDVSMNYDLIEKVPSVEDEPLPPLPSRWSNNDIQPGLELLSDGLELKLGNSKLERDREHESFAVRANYPMPVQCGIYYFEVTILAREREESSIGIGFSSKKVPLSRLPGWEPESWAYHGDDGHSYCSQPSGKIYGPSFSANDVIGCGVIFRTNSAFFTKNGDHLGTAFRDVKGKLYPSVGMKKAGEHITVNFGQRPFIFDINSLMEREKSLVEFEIKQTSSLKLAHPLCETEFIQALVLQFFIHDGYVDTARAFAKEILSEKKALSLDPQAVIPKFDIKEDEDAGRRQQIRTAVLDGDIDTALKYTNSYYPQVLKDNEQVYFRLRCRKFVEMIQEAAEKQKRKSSTWNKTSNGHRGHWHGENVDKEMQEINNQHYMQSYDNIDAEEDSLSYSEHTRLLQETIKYGTELSAEFKDDPRKEVKKALEDAFALMAYQEPLKAKGVAYLLDSSGRVSVAEELNSAILQSLGRPASAALEKLCQQTTILLEDLRENGGSAAALLNVDDYINPTSNS
ncbi:hypothetical protein K3495_g5288 [Podosphaera aphanis]|nr:hypothetical protein K3495_g5288 [Podosphaera aphanis]